VISLSAENLKVQIGGADILDVPWLRLGGDAEAVDAEAVDAVAGSGGEVAVGADSGAGERAPRIGIVGESGSGKTMLVRSLMGLLPAGASVSGSYTIDGSDFDLNAKEREWRKVRGARLGMVMQDPFTALDPLGKCGRQILDGVPKSSRASFDTRAALAEVGLAADIAERYPRELSGGQRQRVVIAAALATEPQLLIADEATTALDVITQKGILDLLDEIREKRSMPLVLITHNIRLVYQRTDTVIVMDGGRIVETGATREVIANPQSAYTRALIEEDRLLRVSAYPEYRVGGPVILKVRDVEKSFGSVRALDRVSIEVCEGEIVGIVGESGSGKTTLARIVAGLESADGGEVKFFAEGTPKIVFQDPYSSLNPAHTVRFAIEEALAAFGRPLSELSEVMNLAELDESLLDRRPAKLSGGQRQRVAIARALATHPSLIVFDESVSALDIATQNRILGMIERLRSERQLAVLFITHDLSVVRMLAGRIYVMHEGRIVDSGSAEHIFEDSKEGYTRALVNAS
jgi:peptide/nickel transport system ATP-binding protein